MEFCFLLLKPLGAQIPLAGSFSSTSCELQSAKFKLNDKKYLNNLGLSQQERSSDALRPDYFAIDEIDLDKFIEFISSYSSYIPFYNDQNKLDGDWSILTEGDITLKNGQ